MAYRRTTRTTRTTRSPARRASTSRVASGRRSTSRVSRTRGTATRSSGGTRTIRLVIEQAPANQVARPELLQSSAPEAPKKSQF